MYCVHMQRLFSACNWINNCLHFPLFDVYVLEHDVFALIQVLKYF